MNGDRKSESLSPPLHADPGYLSALVSLENASVATGDNAPQITSRPKRGSIAVLPFTNLSGDPDQDYFADGLSEDVLTELQRFKNLFVIARHSSFSFKGKSTSLEEAGRILDVEYIVSGSIRHSNKRIRIAAHLVQVASGQEIWAERYDRVLEDIFDLQDEIVRTIVVTLESRLGTVFATEAKKKAIPNLQAYDCIQLARSLTSNHKAAEAMPLIQRAIELDPNYPLAQWVLANVHYVNYLETADPVSLSLMEKAARNSIALDPSDSRAHAVLGMALICKRQYKPAGESLNKAVSLNPADSRALAYQAEFLFRTGAADKAILLMDELLQRDPIPPPFYFDIRGLACLFARRFEDCIADLSRLDYDFWYVHGYLAVAHAKLGNMEAARAEIARLLDLKPGMTTTQYLSLESCPRTEDLDLIAEGLRLAGLPE